MVAVPGKYINNTLRAVRDPCFWCVMRLAHDTRQPLLRFYRMLDRKPQQGKAWMPVVQMVCHDINTVMEDFQSLLQSLEDMAAKAVEESLHVRGEGFLYKNPVLLMGDMALLLLLHNAAAFHRRVRVFFSRTHVGFVRFVSKFVAGSLAHWLCRELLVSHFLQPLEPACRWPWPLFQFLEEPLLKPLDSRKAIADRLLAADEQSLEASTGKVRARCASELALVKERHRAQWQNKRRSPFLFKLFANATRLWKQYSVRRVVPRSALNRAPRGGPCSLAAFSTRCSA